MSLGMVFGGYLALNDRAQRDDAAAPDMQIAIDLPDPESELLPPLMARNHWNDMDTVSAHT
jgi:hypothetical protein